MAEGTELVRQTVCDDSPDSDFNAVESLKQEQPQTAVEFIQIHNLIESCSCPEVVRTWNAKGDEIRAEPIIANPLKPLYCSLMIAAVEAATVQPKNGS